MVRACLIVMIIWLSVHPDSARAQFTARNETRLILEGFQRNYNFVSSALRVNFNKNNNQVTFKVAMRSFSPVDSLQDSVKFKKLFHKPGSPNMLNIRINYQPLTIELANLQMFRRDMNAVISLHDESKTLLMPVSFLPNNQNLFINSILHFNLKALDIDIPESLQNNMTGHAKMVLSRIRWVDYTSR